MLSRDFLSENQTDLERANYVDLDMSRVVYGYFFSKLFPWLPRSLWSPFLYIGVTLAILKDWGYLSPEIKALIICVRCFPMRPEQLLYNH